MPISPYLSLILPAYNEAKRIRETIHAIRSYCERQRYSFEIIAAVDGTDGTHEIVRELTAQDPRILLLGGRERGGKGLAIRQGVAQASGRIIGFADADNKVPISEIDKLLPWFRQGYDIVIGSRAVADARVEVCPPLHRRLGSRAFALAMHSLIGLWKVHDTQCGFKFFLQPVARALFSRQRVDGYMFDVEVLHLAQRWGYRIKEVGVRWRDDGDTRLRLIAGNWRNMLDILRIRFARYDRPTVAVSYPDPVGESKKAG